MAIPPFGLKMFRSRCGSWVFGVALMALWFIAPTYGAARAQGAQPVEEAAIFALESPYVKTLLEHASAAESGRTQPRNLMRAAQFYCEAASFGSLEAQYRLGRMYLDGRGLPRSLAIAATLLGIAARSGHEGAGLMLPLAGVHEEALPQCMNRPEVSVAKNGR